MNQLEPDLFYWNSIVPLFGSDEATQRAFAQYLVDGDPFDLPATVPLTTWGVLQRYANWPMIHATMLARLLKNAEGPPQVKYRVSQAAVEDYVGRQQATESRRPAKKAEEAEP